jgi:anti-sigma regulatory factor (Ser/Thr protein kinase)
MTLDQWFDAGTLPGLRRAVQAEAVAAGMPRDRADEVMLAVHELAANAVRHGGGTGRVRLEMADGALRCQVSDTGHASDTGQAGHAGRSGADGFTRAGAVVTGRPSLFRPGHGLWLVRSLADQIAVVPGPAGWRVTAVFDQGPVLA